MTIQFAPTWNNVGIDLTCIRANATDILSGSGSTLIDLQVNGISKFSVNKNGVITANGVAVPKITSGTAEPSGGNDGDIYFQYQDATGLTTYVPATRIITINNVAYDLSANRSWTIATTGITSINNLTSATQTIVTGTSGNDFNIYSDGTVHTLNIPDASATARGLITTGAQTVAGEKTFTSNVLTSGYVRTGTSAADVRYGQNGISNYSSGTIYNIISWTGGNVIDAIQIVGYAYQGIRLERLGGIQTWCCINFSVAVAGGNGGQPRTPLDVRGTASIAGDIIQHNGTTAVKYESYNTFTSSTSYERLSIGWSSNICTIATEKGSAGGSDRVLRVQGFEIPVNYTASPNNTVNHVSLQATGATTNVSASIVPKGSGSFSLAVPDGTVAGGNVRGPRSVDLQLSRSVSADVADGTDAALIGTYACRNSGNQSVVSGSNICYILGGAYNAISASSNCNVNFGNNLNTILSSQYAVARRSCQIIFGSGIWASSGDQQSFMVTGAAKTTTNDAVEVNFGLGNGNIPVYINVHSGYVVSGTLIIHGVKSDGSATARFCRNFTIRRVINTTTLDNLEVVGVDYPNGTSISITADDTNDRLSVRPTGVLNEIWRWQIHGICIEQAYGT